MATITADATVTVAAAQRAERQLRQQLADQYTETRSFTEKLVTGLAAEDMVVQSMADVSPTKWHLAHTSWFFERFVLMDHLAGYMPLDPVYLYLFNSYYQQAGERHCRDQRGYISRPTVTEVMAYRQHVDAAIRELIAAVDEGVLVEIAPLLTLGVHHEQQHQELLLTDIKHVFSVNPMRPVYREMKVGGPVAAVAPVAWAGFDAGVYEIGHSGPAFAYDNETPRHRVFLESFEIADRLVTNGEYLEFINDGGYQRPEIWLSLGWTMVEEHAWSEPFYWEKRDGEWMLFTLRGMERLNPSEPVCHLSYYEADAFARWAGARLPTEAEWEVAAVGVAIEGNFVEQDRYHPAPVAPAAGIRQLYGDVWEWTSSAYAPYPGFRAAAGAVGEYNGKFMCNQYVLRGGSCATSRTHIRPTYRNFFPPEAAWQFTGLRLARDGEQRSER